MRSPWERPREGETPPPTYWERPQAAVATPAPALEAAVAAPSLHAPAAVAAAEPRREPTAGEHALAISMALIGGVLGIFGAVVNEVQAGGLVFLAAGIIEEALKPSGIYVVLLRWPHILYDRYYTAALSALSGLVFAVIEAAMYILVYFPDAGPDFVLYRLTAPLAMHTGASFIFGMGIHRGIVDWANGMAPFPRDSKRYMLTAMGLHAGFNLVMVALEIGGVLDLDTGR
jgi:RsiW-degrading membrane proteinase PrsW (M82 family)